MMIQKKVERKLYKKKRWVIPMPRLKKKRTRNVVGIYKVREINERGGRLTEWCTFAFTMNSKETWKSLEDKQASN